MRRLGRNESHKSNRRSTDSMRSSGQESRRDSRPVLPAQSLQRNVEVNLMPKRTDIKSILIIGAGPSSIGQACEFDYSGAQACKALRSEGYRVILVNSNP